MRYATLKLIMSFGPCYTEQQVIDAMGGRKRLTPRQYGALNIPEKDRLWGMFRVWPEFVGPTLEIAVERAIRRALGKSGSEKWEQWANAWLGGSDRTSAAASDAAYYAASAPYYAARVAARAAHAYATARAAARGAHAYYAASAAYYAASVASYAGGDYAAVADSYAAELNQIIDDFIAVAEHQK